MKIQNTDTFRDKKCVVEFNDNTSVTGTIRYCPTFSEKHGYKPVGWYIEKENEDLYFKFKDVKGIEVLDHELISDNIEEDLDY